MCDDGAEGKRRVPYAFLDDVKERFKATYGEASRVSSTTLNQQLRRKNSLAADCHRLCNE